MKAIINNKEIEIDNNIRYIDLVDKYQQYYEYNIVAVKENNVFVDIYSKVKENANIVFFDYSDKEANKIYINGLIFMTIYSIVELYGKDTFVNVKHSIDKGLFLKVNKNIDILKIKEKMLEIVDKKLPITRHSVNRLEEIKYFERNALKEKVELLKYSTNTYITLYKLADMYDFYFSQLPYNTSLLDKFDLSKEGNNGFVLTFPTSFLPKIVPLYKPRKGLFNLFEEHSRIMSMFGIKTVVDLNKIVLNYGINDLIRIEETLQSDRLLNVANQIYLNKNKIKIILLSGPSSSGKTTTSIKLCNYLKSFGVKTIKLSMDDYYLPTEETPLDEDGNKDYDNITAINLELFDKQIKELLEGKEVITPIFNFKKGKAELVNNIKLDNNQLLVIEGIHALNPEILKDISRDSKFKIYISPTTDLNIDNHNRIATTDNRLLRRMIRDARTRGNKAEDTLKSWNIVRRGEERFIFPYQDEADAMLNTALIYELGVLHVYALPLLYSVDINSSYYDEAKRLINLLKNILPIPSDEIPRDSIIREFIGGSCYEVQ